jgi:integrase
VPEEVRREPRLATQREEKDAMAHTTSRDGILKVGPRHYRVFIELPKTTEGARLRESHTVRGSLEQAKTKRAQLLAEQSRGLYVGRSEQRLDDYLESWLSWKRSQVSERTWERYASLLRSSVIPALGALRLQDLTPQHLDEFYARSLATEAGQRTGSKLSPTTVHHRHVALKMALMRAVEIGVLSRNPAQSTSPPRPSRPELRIPTEDEARRLLAALANTSAEMPAYLALTTGARLGEILALRWSDIELGAGVARVRRTVVEHLLTQSGGAWYDFKEPKSGHGRSVDLGAATMARLKTHRKIQAEVQLAAGSGWNDLDLVITTNTGEPMRPSTTSARFRGVVGKTALAGVRFHDLRHAHATFLLKAGTPPHVVSQRLGHSTVAFTLQVYAHVLPGQQREAAEALETALLGAGG